MTQTYTEVCRFHFYAVVPTPFPYPAISVHLLGITSFTAFNCVLKIFCSILITCLEYYLILLDKFSINVNKGEISPCFCFNFKGRSSTIPKTILSLKNKKAVKCVNICKHVHVFN